MGTFYTNVTVKTAAAAAAVASTLGDRAAYLWSGDGAVVVFDEQSDEQDTAVIRKLGETLSRAHRCAALSVLLHDGDVFWYELHDRGTLIDDYNSYPGYGEEGGEDEPAGGDAAVLCHAFSAGANAHVIESVLHGDGYTFAQHRHADLVRLLGLPEAAVNLGFGYLEREPHGPEFRRLGARRAAAPRLRGLLPQPFVRPLPPLSELVGTEPQFASEVFKKVMDYARPLLIRDSGLIVQCDDRLRAVFGVDRIPMLDIAGRVTGMCALIDVRPLP